jgi:hypothetical protein
MYRKAKEAQESYLSRFGDHKAIRRSRAYVYRDQGRLDMAHDEVDKAFLLAPDD